MLKQQVRNIFRKMSIQNKMFPIVAEYLQKKDLAKLGYQFSSDKLTAYKANSFNLISNELAKLQNEENERLRRKNG